MNRNKSDKHLVKKKMSREGGMYARVDFGGV